MSTGKMTRLQLAVRLMMTAKTPAGQRAWARYVASHRQPMDDGEYLGRLEWLNSLTR